MGHRLVAATPPRDVKRVPRVAKDRKWWKAKEFENGLPYFSIPELKGIWTRLALHTGPDFHIMLKQNISARDMARAEGLLVGLYFPAKNLHGKVPITVDVQQLLHIIKSVHH